MEPLIKRFYFSDEIGAVEPDRKIFEHVVADLGAPPEGIFFFDDTSVHVRAARNVGLAAFEVDGLTELETCLQRIGVA